MNSYEENHRMHEAVIKDAFTASGYDEKFARVNVSNRPDLCEYQCNGAMAAAKTYKKAPIMIANDVVEKIKESDMFSQADASKTRDLSNLKINDEFLAYYLNDMRQMRSKFSVEKAESPKTIIIDYGGPNVAKPLHVGHLRSAIIGESLKRMGRFLGHKVIGDVHLGDWGLQMGLIITELKKRSPELVYLDACYQGGISGRSAVYHRRTGRDLPRASGKIQEDEDYRNEALEATCTFGAGKARLYGSLESYLWKFL